MSVLDKSVPPKMTIRHRLATMCEPRSIALVGATEKSLWSQLIIRNFGQMEFEGKLFAINRTGSDVFGVPGFAACAEIGEPVDLAFIMVPKPAVIGAIEDAAAAGIGNAIVLTSGYAEIGAEGAADQQVLLARARELGVVIWGPNTLGFTNMAAGIPASSIPVQRPLLPPSIAIVSQSGASASELNDYAYGQNIGSSFIAATGNQGDVTLSHVIDYLVDHEPTKAIALFVENICDPLAFIAAARRARANGKPVVILKIGRTELAGAVAQAHTGALLGDDAVFGAVCERLGVVRVDTMEDLINTAGLLAAVGPLPKQGVSFLSISGGSCTLAADSAEKYGVSMPENDEATKRAMREVLPSFASTLNPLDVTGMAMNDPGLFERIIPVVASAQEVGLVAISMTIPTYEGHGVPAILDAIGRGVAAIDKPAILVTPTIKSFTDVTRRAAQDSGLPHIITGIDAMLKATGKAAWWSSRKQAANATLALEDQLQGNGERPGSEREVLDYLATRGVPVIPGKVVTDGQAAQGFAAAQSGPFALKVSSPDIAHKTEVGGVRLNVADGDIAATFEVLLSDVATACPDARIDGVQIAPMRSEPCVELIVGVSHDREWGPTITVGMGGTLVELLADAVVAPLPVAREDVLEMLGKLKGAKLLDGYRGADAIDRDALADAIVAIGKAALDLGPDLASLEFNPLRASATRIEALDALALWNEESAQ